MLLLHSNSMLCCRLSGVLFLDPAHKAIFLTFQERHDMGPRPPPPSMGELEWEDEEEKKRRFEEL